MLRFRTSTEAANIIPRSKQKGAVLVCVTYQQACRRLIYEGAKIARRKNLRLLVLSVNDKNTTESPERNDILERLFMAAAEFGAEMSVYYNSDPIAITNLFIKRNDIVCCVTGTPSQNGRFVRNIQENHPDIELLWSADDDSIIAPFSAINRPRTMIGNFV